MQKLFLLALSIVPGMLAAGDQVIDRAKEKANVITFNVMMYHDAEYNEESWQALLDEAIAPFNTSNENRNRGETNIAAIRAFIQSLETIAEHQLMENNGIHGNMTISISDGKPINRCGEKCPCVKRYGGVCPCGGDTNFCKNVCKGCGECNVS